VDFCHHQLQLCLGCPRGLTAATCPASAINCSPRKVLQLCSQGMKDSKEEKCQQVQPCLHGWPLPACCELLPCFACGSVYLHPLACWRVLMHS